MRLALRQHYNGLLTQDRLKCMKCDRHFKTLQPIAVLLDVRMEPWIGSDKQIGYLHELCLDKTTLVFDSYKDINAFKEELYEEEGE